MAEYQRHPLARPHDVGQDFWAAGYAGPSLWDRQKYIDPRTGQVWESLEEALRFLSEHTMPDITARDVNLPPGPPGEAAFRISQEVPTILPRPAGSAPVVTAVPEVSSGVHELRKAIEREETEPQFQSIDTSMLSRLIPSAQASDLAPLPPPPTSEELWEDRIDRGVALQELLKLEEAPSGPTPLRQPQIGPTQIEQPEVGPSLLEPPPIPIKAKTIDLPGGKIENGELILDESPEAWAEFLNRKVAPEEIPEEAPSNIGYLPGKKSVGEALNLLDSKPDEEEKELEEKDETGLLGVIKDAMSSVISESKASGTVSTPSFSSEVHDLYAALSDAEHRSDKHRKNRWIYADVPGADEKKAWGPVQMKPDTLKEAKRVGSLSSGIPLTAEEESYVNSFLQGNRYVGKKDKELYISIAKKLLHYYSNKYKDPLRIANVWRWGERGSAPKSKSFGKGRYGLGRDISSPVGDPGSDLAYWEEFKRMMGL
jgi:hypothetical protein